MIRCILLNILIYPKKLNDIKQFVLDHNIQYYYVYLFYIIDDTDQFTLEW